MANTTLPKIVVAKLLHLSRPSKRVGNAVRAWWAMRSQKRRRARSTATAPTPPVPVITGGNYTWDATEPGLADVDIAWVIDYGSFPVASVEVFWRVDEGPEQSLGTVPSSDDAFYHPRASGGGEMLTYRVRYVFEDFSGPVVGAFSEPYQTFISI
jgi:hypothetical protein